MQRRFRRRRLFFKTLQSRLRGPWKVRTFVPLIRNFFLSFLTGRWTDLRISFLSRCEDSSCVCEAGWRGPRCGEKDCDARCSFHGQCKNGTCLCVAGWNGLHCTLEGCPNGCSNHGSCKANFRGEWSCHCHPGWEGPDCSVRLETRCNDGYDDDQGNFSLLQGVPKSLFIISVSI